MKTAEREAARTLRRDEGRSIKEIATLLRVAPSSVSLWVRDIELTDGQREALRRRNPAFNGQAVAARNRAARARAVREAAQREGRDRASGADLLHAAGSMLFWAEGSRTRNAIRFTNSDPAMVRFFVRFLRECYGVPDDRIRVTCNLFADHAPRRVEIENFWLDSLELPRSSLCRSVVNVYSKYSQKKRKNKLPYGTCRVAVHDTRVVQSIYGAIQEYGGFDRPEWIDC